MSAGFQGHVQVSAAQVGALLVGASVLDEIALGVGAAERPVVALGDDDAVAHRHGAHRRVRGHTTETLAGEFQRPRHEPRLGAGIHGLTRQAAPCPHRHTRGRSG